MLRRGPLASGRAMLLVGCCGVLEEFQRSSTHTTLVRLAGCARVSAWLGRPCAARCPGGVKPKGGGQQSQVSWNFAMKIELKSLILAQIERWRHALHMQVERQRGGNPGGERRTGE